MTRPFDPAMKAGYIDDPNRVRIYYEVYADGPSWDLDGIKVNDDGLVVGYTESVWSFATWADALAAVTEFIRDRNAVPPYWREVNA